MAEPDKNQLKETFNVDPALYDRARRGYPDRLFHDLAAYQSRPSLASLNVLEIAPGTGQATGDLLNLGATVTAVELGSELAAFLRRKFVDREKLSVLTGAFEEIDLPKERFGLIVCATAWHWLDHEVRFKRSFELLQLEGCLAIINTHQVDSPADKGFSDRVQLIYDRHGSSRKSRPPVRDKVAGDDYEMRVTGLFSDITVTHYDWDQVYTTVQYLDLLRSYSGTIAMELTDRNQFLSAIGNLIDSEFAGEVVRPLVVTLTLGRKNASYLR